jgi:hypothetical protein
MKKFTKEQLLNAPLLHGSHKRPVTRRDFISQGFMAGAASVMMPSLLSLFTQKAYALSDDLDTSLCNSIKNAGAGKIPFICFDLAGGANVAGSNVLVGGRGGQLDFLSTAGYSRLGLPADMIPSQDQQGGNANFNTDLGLAFHNDSGFFRGISEKTAAATRASINGAVIPSRSDNDTGNNPHNPMYGINKAGADGELLTLIGSRSSDSGGNSMAPASMINLDLRPTKVDRASDVTGLVDVGELVEFLQQDQAVSVMESIYRISNNKVSLAQFNTGLSDSAEDEKIKNAVRCAYMKSAHLLENYGDPSSLNPELDSNIVGTSGIFTQQEYDSDREFQKTAAIMKMVIEGYAGAGTITMGGYDYHTGDRAVGEVRDLRAGRCMGACLEYAARLGKPLMMYVFSDGSVFSNGMIDNSENGRGKGVWTGDNSSTAASFFLIYNPDGRIETIRQQVGYMNADASVDTTSSPVANNPNLLAESVVLNYLALHGEEGRFADVLTNNGLSSNALNSLIAFPGIVNGTMGS